MADFIEKLLMLSLTFLYKMIVQKNEQNVQSETETIQDNGLKKDF